MNTIYNVYRQTSCNTCIRPPLGSYIRPPIPPIGLPIAPPFGIFPPFRPRFSGFGGQRGLGGGGGVIGNNRQRLARGVREVIFAVNAFCDDSCTSDQQQDAVTNCVQNGIIRNSQMITILRSCSSNPNGDLQCSRQRRNRLNQCLIRRAVNRRGLVNRRLQRCFRSTLTLATIDCLVRRYRILNSLLPLTPGPYGPVVNQRIQQPVGR